jgi:hypothetical protein
MDEVESLHEMKGNRSRGELTGARMAWDSDEEGTVAEE